MDKLLSFVAPMLSYLKQGVAGVIDFAGDAAKNNPKTTALVAAGGYSVYDPQYWRAFFEFVMKIAKFLGGVF